VIDILIPVYNEGTGIVKVLDHLKAAVHSPFRVLVCYDRDEDDTLPVLDAYSAPFEIVRVKNEGRGVHGAVMTGFRKSSAPALIAFPADDSYNGGIIDGMIARFRAGADIVAASRFMPGGCMKGCPLVKAVLVRTAAFVLYHAARVPTHDPTNGFRLFSSKVLKTVRVESTEGWAFSVELLVKTHRLGWKVEETPALWFERESGRSRFRLFKWMPVYLRWFFYAFATTCLGRGPTTVPTFAAEAAV